LVFGVMVKNRNKREREREREREKAVAWFKKLGCGINKNIPIVEINNGNENPSIGFLYSIAYRSE
jgi:hypothetical protein